MEEDVYLIFNPQTGIKGKVKRMAYQFKAQNRGLWIYKLLGSTCGGIH